MLVEWGWHLDIKYIYIYTQKPIKKHSNASCLLGPLSESYKIIIGSDVDVHLFTGQIRIKKKIAKQQTEEKKKKIRKIENSNAPGSF